MSTVSSTNNPYYIAAQTPNQATGSAVTSSVSNLARSSNKAPPNLLEKDGTVIQTERLYTARARYGQLDLIGNNGSDLGGSRGQWAYIKLLTSQKQYSEYLSGSTSRDVTYKELIGEKGIATIASDIGNNKKVKGYDKFLITGVSCDMSEKVQISEVFGDGEVVYYFGRAPLIFNIRGVLIDSPDNNWFVDWLKMYSEFLRGSQTAKNYELIKIVLPNMAITGTISSFSYSQDSQRDIDIPFAFQFIAKLIEPIAANLGPMVNTNLVKNVDFSQANTFLSGKGINSLKAQVAHLSSTVQDPLSSLRDKGAALGQIGSGVGGAFGDFLKGVKGTEQGIQATIDGWNKAQNSAFSAIANSTLYQTVTSSLNGIRTNLFSPIYGILSSLTKLVNNTVRNATALFNGIITPIRNILRDITNLSNQATALVNLVNNSIQSFGRNITNQIKGLTNDYKTAIKTLSKTAGTIASAPFSAAHSLKAAFSSGTLTTNSAFLTNTSHKIIFVRPSLTILGKAPATKIELLENVTSYAPKTSNTL
jgi:hypothetical protein